MGSARVGTALLALVASLAGSALVWYYLGNPFLFLVVPVVPFLFRRARGGQTEQPPRRVCGECGFSTRDPEYEFCPRDGRPLREE